MDKFDLRMEAAEHRMAESDRRFELRMKKVDERMKKVEEQILATTRLVALGMKMVVELTKSQQELGPVSARLSWIRCGVAMGTGMPTGVFLTVQIT